MAGGDSGSMKRSLSIPHDRAAYQASQELFDVLRSECATLTRCTKYLEGARDRIQGIHATVDKNQAAMAMAEVSEHYHPDQFSANEGPDRYSILMKMPSAATPMASELCPTSTSLS